MKIKNVGNKELKIAFTPKKGKQTIVDLKMGQIVFGEKGSIDNNQIIILKRKGKIEITEDDKPKGGEYYKAYGTLPHAEIVKLTNQETKKPSIILEEVDEVELDDEPGILPVEVVEEPGDINEDDMEDDLDDEDDNEDEDDDEKQNLTSQKNKGGRPKGSKNKPKKGRPKNKKK